MAHIVPSITFGPITQVDNSALYPLGVIYQEPAAPGNDPGATATASSGGRRFRYVFNDDAAVNWAQGEIVCAEAAKGKGYSRRAPVDTDAVICSGVAQWAVAFGKYAWVQTGGIGEVLADTGGISADTAIKVGNAVAGRADDAASDDHAIGYSTEAVAATALATCYLTIMD